MQASIKPYLFFGGRCAEALEFYHRAIGAEIGMVMRFDQCPDPLPDGVLAPGFEHKVMHAAFRVGDAELFASDGCGPEEKFAAISLALTLPDEAAAHAAFTALAEGGAATMPLGPTFWSPCYGMLTDRFGLGWMVTVAAPSPV